MASNPDGTGIVIKKEDGEVQDEGPHKQCEETGRLLINKAHHATHHNGHKMGKHDSHHQGWYSRPRVRQQWNEDWEHPHVNWGDLFFDLPYVGVAYQMGYVVLDGFCYDSNPTHIFPADYKPSGGHHRMLSALSSLALPQGLAEAVGEGEGEGEAASAVGSWFECEHERTVYFALILYRCALMAWINKKDYSSFMVTDDHFHKFLDTVEALTVVLAGSSIRNVNDFIHPGSDYCFTFCFSLFVNGLIQCFRWCEVMWAHSAHNVRRHSLKLLFVVFNFTVAMFVGAILSLERDPDSSQHDSTEGDEEWGPVICIIYAATIDIVLAAIYMVRVFIQDYGKELTVEFMQKRKEARWMASSAEFTSHRHGEFMMLMIGEAVLALVIASRSHTEEERVHYYTLMVSGFLLAVFLQFAHYVTEPHDIEHHVLARSPRTSILWRWCWQAKCFTIMMVGIGLKIMLKYPHYVPSTALARILCVPLAVSFLLNQLMYALHRGMHIYFFPPRLRANPARTMVIFGKCVVLVCIDSLPNIVNGEEPTAESGLACGDFAVVAACMAFVLAGLIFYEQNEVDNSDLDDWEEKHQAAKEEREAQAAAKLQAMHRGKMTRKQCSDSKEKKKHDEEAAAASPMESVL